MQPSGTPWLVLRPPSINSGRLRFLNQNDVVDVKKTFPHKKLCKYVPISNISEFLKIIDEIMSVWCKQFVV